MILESTNEQFKSVTVYNSLGQKASIKELSQNAEIVDLTSLENGVYFAKLAIGNTTKTIKFFKQ